MGTGLGLLLVGLLAALLRSLWAWPQVVRDSGIWLQGNDPWYHLRLIHHLYANFPQPLLFDSQAAHGGMAVPAAPGLDFLAVALAWLRGCAPEEAACVDLAAAWTPVVIGVLLTVATFFLLRSLVSRGWALGGALLAAVLPGPLLMQTTLGVVDHHGLEALLTTIVLTGLAIGQKRRVGLWIAALALAAYHLSWSGAALFVAAIGVWWLLASILCPQQAARLHRQLVAVLLPTLVTVVLLQAWIPRSALQLLAIGGLFTAASLTLVLGRCWPTAPTLLPALVILALGTAAIALLSVTTPALLEGLLIDLRRFWPGRVSMTVVEMIPALVGSDGELGIGRIWAWYGALSLVAIYGLGWLLWEGLRNRDPVQLLIVSWASVAILAMLAQGRFAYYVSTLMPVLVVYLSSRLWGLARAERPSRARNWRVAVLVAAAGVLLLIPVMRTPEHAALDRTPRLAWREATAFLTAEATADTAVLCWWDQGYLLLVRGGVQPFTNPSHINAAPAAQLYLSTDMAGVLDDLQSLQIRYIALGEQLRPRMVSGRFQGYLPSLLAWAEADFDDYFVRSGGRFQGTARWRQTLLARLLKDEGLPSGIEAAFTSSDGTVRLFSVTANAAQ